MAMVDSLASSSAERLLDRARGTTLGMAPRSSSTEGEHATLLIMAQEYSIVLKCLLLLVPTVQRSGAGRVEQQRVIPCMQAIAEP